MEKSPNYIIAEVAVDQAVANSGAANIKDILSEVTGAEGGLDPQQQLRAIDAMEENPDIPINVDEARLIKRELVLLEARKHYQNQNAQSRRNLHFR